jgi:hypothetical protein
MVIAAIVVPTGGIALVAIEVALVVSTAAIAGSCLGSGSAGAGSWSFIMSNTHGIPNS